MTHERLNHRQQHLVELAVHLFFVHKVWRGKTPHSVEIHRTFLTAILPVSRGRAKVLCIITVSLLTQAVPVMFDANVYHQVLFILSDFALGLGEHNFLIPTIC